MKLKNFFVTEAYAIKNVKTGMFSTGGQYPKMQTEGKFWKKIGDVHCHISQANSAMYCDSYKDCVIVKFTLLPSGEVAKEIIEKL